MADEPKIHIDSDWKAQAQAEREKLRESEQKKQSGQPGQSGQGQSQPAGGEAAGASGGEAGEGGREMPPANFDTLMQTLASNALLAMGAVPDPETGQRYAHMGLAKHHIDMLGVLQEKTRGNLSDEEEQTLSTTLYELRNAFVQLTEQARQMQQGQGGEASGMVGGAGPQPGPGMQGPGGPLQG